MNMALFIFSMLVLVASALCASPLRFVPDDDIETFSLFQQWQETHGKVYETSQEQMSRYQIFVDNLKTISDLNSKRVHPEDAFFGPTQFADLTAQEFHNTVLTRTWTPGGPEHKRVHYNSSVRAPESFDWTKESGDIVNSVKDQGQSGTCWAFAGTANVESLWAKKTGKASPDLSTEALNDCDGLLDVMQGAVACGPLGATMPGFYLWVIQEGGLMTWEDYPYCVGNNNCKPCAPEGYSEEYCGGPWPISSCKTSDSCDAKYDKSKFVEGLKVTDFQYLVTDEKVLLDALVEIGPLNAGIDATDMQFYSGGILKPDQCDPEALNHAVLLVGYGADDGADFWRAKNSWGTGWGEDGFLRIERGTTACGINMDISTAVLED